MALKTAMTIKRLTSATDKRIISVYQQNMGLARSLNKGIKGAKGKFIARQDADDISLPKRFEFQKMFFNNNPKIVLCGTWFQEINENAGYIVRKYPLDDVTLRKNIKYINYFCHPSVMFLKKAFIKAGGYDESFTTAQDFELWIRLAKTGEIANLPEVLVKKRIGFTHTISWKDRKKKIEVVRKVISKHFPSWHEVNVFKFLRYYFPLLIYGFIPMPMLKLLRGLRYRA